MNTKCVYLVEGSCEKQLISALKEHPSKLIPGKVRVFNLIQKRLPKSMLLTIQPGTIVVLAFDTDVPQTDALRDNIKLLRQYCVHIKLVFLAQVTNLEDELIRCTDVDAVVELTKSEGTQKFKNDFCRMKPFECRTMLERHHLEVARLWTTAASEPFQFVEQNSGQIKL